MTQLQSLAFAPGTMREYETIYILKPDTIADQVGEVNTRVKGIIEDGGGKILKLDNWGKRRLAYEIQKERKGVYLYWQYLGGPEIVAEFERNLRMLDPVIRYMTVRLDENVDPAERLTDVDDETFERAAVTASDEEDALLSGSDEDEDEDDAAEGDAVKADAGEGDAVKADAAEGDAVKADAAEGDAVKADAAEGDAVKADAAEGDAVKADAAEGDNSEKDAPESAPAAAKSEEEE